jgi:CPA2 family monovalent cation:H+ antiporter-2
VHTIAFLRDLAVIMLTAGVVTVLFHLLRQPVVLGYIVAGVLIGPHATLHASLVTDETTIRTLAELGVVFLLFSLGLEFRLGRLRRVGATALLAALAGIVTMLWLGYEIGLAFAWRALDALFLGALLSVSSTTITLKALEDLGLKKEPFAEVVFAILIVEDVLAIGILVLLSSAAHSGDVAAGEVLRTLAGLMVFLVATLVLGILTIPRLIDFVAAFHRNEMLLVAVLGVLFGICLLVTGFGYGTALGAFVSGVIVAESRAWRSVERLIEPVRDMFSAIFFVAIGLLLDPRGLGEYALPIAVITVVVVLGKTLSRALFAFIAGQSWRTALRIGMSLAQIGEFSFLIVGLGAALHATSDFLYPIAVAVSALTTLLTPYLIRAADPLARGIRAATPHGLRRVLQMYTSGLQRLRLAGDRAALASMVRRILVQAFINFCLVAAIFGGVAYLAGSQLPDLSAWVTSPALRNAMFWGAALLLALPFLIAAYRKLKALAMLLAEATLRSGRHTARVQRIVAEIIPAASTAGMLLLVSALSSSILPPAELLVAVLAMGALILALLWRTLVRLHSRLQIALLERLQANKEPR